MITLRNIYYRKPIVLLLILTALSMMSINCATTEQSIQQPVRNPIYIPQQQVVQPSQIQTPAPIPQELPDIIYLNITPQLKNSELTVYFNQIPVAKYAGVNQPFKIDKSIKLPIEITISVPDTVENYKTTFYTLSYYSPNQTVNIQLKKKLREASKKIISLFVDIFNSAYEYYTTKDVTVFSKIQPGSFYYISEAFDEIPNLEADEVMKIVDMINKNIRLPENDITSVIRTGVDLMKNIYIKKNGAQKMTVAEELKLKEEITNDFTKLWWRIFEIIKNYNK